MVRTNQRGSIMGFVAIGGIMALLLIGGAYIVRHTLAASSESTQPTVTEESGDDTPVGQPATNEKDESAEEEAALPGREDTSSQPTPQTTAPADLPQTGPADGIMTSILLGGMVGAGLLYKRSRSASSL